MHPHHLTPFPTLPLPLPLLLLLLLPLLASAQRFKDVSKAVGIDHTMGPRKKYGGPTIADLNSDGHPDLLFCHHDKFFIEIYINTGRASFRKLSFRFFSDSHGVVAFRPTAFSKNMRFSVSPGGSAGTKPATPKMWEYVFANNSIVEVTESAGIDAAGGRGRTALYLNLRNNALFRPDVIYTNAGVIPGFEPQQFGYKNKGRGKFKLKTLKGFKDTTNEMITVTDLDNDGKVEIVTYQDLKIYKLIAPFKFKDITAKVLPTNDYRGTVAVAELDFDGDGDFDLYVVRTNTGSFQWVPGEVRDYLFENRNGVYVDVSQRAKIPLDPMSRAVTTGDFNNDGWIDVFLTMYNKPDILLLNNGDGTFKTVSGKIPRPGNSRGDSAQAVDYNSDGRLDLVVGQGDRDNEDLGGFYRVFKNKLSLNDKRRFILVRVGSAPRKLATSLHAVVTVTGSGGFKAIRRVGSPGTAVSSSYIELVHVGIGARFSVNVKVRWVNGATVVKNNVRHGSKINMGEVING